MGKIYKEFFYVPRYGKIHDKVMMAQVALSALVILACLTAMSLSAYAWFSCNITAGTNTIQAADFDIVASVVQNDTPVHAVDGVYDLSDGAYTVSLTKTGNAQTGFCIVETVVNGIKTTFHTQQLQTDETMTFTLQVISESASVQFVPHWGTSVYYRDNENPLYISHGARVEVTVQGATSSTVLPPETGETPEQMVLVHTVVEGENLSWIADAYNTTPQAIADYNDLEDVRIIQIGQQLKIPVAKQEDVSERLQN